MSNNLNTNGNNMKNTNNEGGTMKDRIYKIGITESGDAGLDFTWDSQEYKDMPKILVTKAPHALLAYIKKNGIENYKNVIIHCTITGFGKTIIEPGVAAPEVTIKAYNELINIYGGEKVILRVDPIVLTDKGEQTAINIIKNRKGRLRISFLDMYSHVIKRFEAAGIDLPYSTFHAPLEKRLNFVEKIRHLGISDGTVEICGEPNMVCTGCVSIRDINALGLDIKLYGFSNQRPTCHCVANKTELLNNKFRCPHKCIYCYWHDNPEDKPTGNSMNNVNNSNNQSINKNKIENNIGGKMREIIYTDQNTDYTPYYTSDGSVVHIYNRNSIFKYLGIRYIYAEKATDMDPAVSISTHVALHPDDLARTLAIFDNSPALLGTYGKKLAVTSLKIVEDKINGLYYHPDHDGGGIVGYDFCDKYDLPKNKVIQMFMIGKNGGFIKGAFIPDKNYKGIWLGNGTIKAGEIKPGTEVVINIFSTVGRHKVNESFEISQWFKDPTPWISYFDNNVSKIFDDIDNLIKYDDTEECNNRALALLKISKEFIHHRYVNRNITEKILALGRKYITSGGRYGYAFPMVADVTVPRGHIIVGTNKYKPGSTVFGFRYPVLSKNGVREFKVIRNTGRRGEWVKINPKDVKEYLLGDFDIDTIVLLKHNPGEYVDGFNYMVKEFPSERVEFDISQLKDKINKKQENIIGLATIALSKAIEVKNEKKAAMVATIIQHQVDSLKKVIKMDDEYKNMAIRIKEIPVFTYMPNWWKVKNSLNNISSYRKLRESGINIEESTVGKIVKHVYDKINTTIDNLPEVYDNKVFVNIFGMGVPMSHKDIRTIKHFEHRIRTIAKIKEPRIRRDAYKYLAIEVHNFAQAISTDNVIWYWNYYHANSNGNGTLAVWLITYKFKEALNLSMTKVIKFNIKANNSPDINKIYEIYTKNTNYYLINRDEKYAAQIYKDQIKYVNTVKYVKIIKVIKISDNSYAVYGIPLSDPTATPEDDTAGSADCSASIANPTASSLPVPPQETQDGHDGTGQEENG